MSVVPKYNLVDLVCGYSSCPFDFIGEIMFWWGYSQYVVGEELLDAGWIYVIVLFSQLAKSEA
jgi:hypothetical protein